MTMDVQQALAVIGEPTRYRIVLLLAEAPRTVGEVAEQLGALQPQTTKHLQALEAAGVVRIHRLGRRRVARLDRDALAQLAAHLHALAQATTATRTDDATLTDYERAITTEEGTDATEHRVRFERLLPAAPDRVWTAWTDPAVAATWWAPRHFEVVETRVAPTPGADVRLVLREGGGAEYTSTGHVVEAAAPARFVFELAPIDAAGTPLFRAVHTVGLAPASDGAATLLVFDIDVTGITDAAAPAVAGLRPGWDQLLDRLVALVGRA
ncbi:metalloregulator ArsR/SmtB family transcription factor [Leifsonia sp. NPDC058194]|uniref:metalloregulator ArsR/SmtB family transcription factor n=1 Tax=Leifsonia sp. NPDC058194 TaxID=3346374 RepID=UPI0036D8F567